MDFARNGNVHTLISQATKEGLLTGKQAKYYTDTLIDTHSRRWQAVAAFAAAENARLLPTGKGASSPRSKTKKSSSPRSKKKSSPAAAGAGASRRNSSRARH